MNILLTVLLLIMTAGCSGNNEDSRSVIYEDMDAAFEQSGLYSSNIGIFSKIVTGDSISYGECGSGVIFQREGDTYYALTAAHVVSVENAQLIVFTVNTEMKSEEIPGLDYPVLAPETYEAMIPAEIEYISSRDDLAVIRFTAEEELAAVEIADGDPEKDDRIICIGNPQMEWFVKSFGKVTSGMEKFGEAHGFPSNAMRHSAYIHVGSSGGAALNEDMKLTGIVPGGSFTPDGKIFRYGVLIPASEIRICLDEWRSSTSYETDTEISWDEISADGVDEGLLMKNTDKGMLEYTAQQLQDLCRQIDEKANEDKEYCLRGQWHDNALGSEEYKNVVSLKEKAMRPLFLIIYKSENAGMYEWICSKALEEISGYDFTDKNNGIGWRNSKEFLEFFIEKVNEERLG